MIDRTLVVMVLVMGCGTSDDLAAVNATLKEKVAGLEKENKRLDREADGLQASLRKLEREVSKARREATYRSLGIEDGPK